MRFLTVNHLRLGTTPAEIPPHVAADMRAFSTRTAWARVVALAKQHDVHAVLLCGETLSHANTGLEPWGPLIDGLADLHQADIPVIAGANGAFTPDNLGRLATFDSIHWLDDTLAWQPIFTTRLIAQDEPAVHIVNGSLSETHDAPAMNPLTLTQLDVPKAIWILTQPQQPDTVPGEHALIIEPGSVMPLTSQETGRHGVWLIDTDTRDARLMPVAGVEFVSIAIDISDAESLDDFERIVSAALVQQAEHARIDNSVATTLVVDATLTGRSRLYPALHDTANELHKTLVIEHRGLTIGLARIVIDATPVIELDPLLGRPDPVGEVAKLIHALTSDGDLTESQHRLLTATEQKLLAVSHARVFGAIQEKETSADAATMLLRQSWAVLDALVRQRRID